MPARAGGSSTEKKKKKEKKSAVGADEQRLRELEEAEMQAIQDAITKQESQEHAILKKYYASMGMPAETPPAAETFVSQLSVDTDKNKGFEDAGVGAVGGTLHAESHKTLGESKTEIMAATDADKDRQTMINTCEIAGKQRAPENLDGWSNSAEHVQRDTAADREKPHQEENEELDIHAMGLLLLVSMYASRLCRLTSHCMSSPDYVK